MTRRPDDLPEEWHNTYDEPSAASWFLKGFAWAVLTGFAVWLALQFIAALAAQ